MDIDFTTPPFKVNICLLSFFFVWMAPHMQYAGTCSNQGLNRTPYNWCRLPIHWTTRDPPEYICNLVSIWIWRLDYQSGDFSCFGFCCNELLSLNTRAHCASLTWLSLWLFLLFVILHLSFLLLKDRNCFGNPNILNWGECSLFAKHCMYQNYES